MQFWPLSIPARCLVEAANLSNSVDAPHPPAITSEHPPRNRAYPLQTPLPKYRGHVPSSPWERLLQLSQASLFLQFYNPSLAISFESRIHPPDHRAQPESLNSQRGRPLAQTRILSLGAVPPQCRRSLGSLHKMEYCRF